MYGLVFKKRLKNVTPWIYTLMNYSQNHVLHEGYVNTAYSGYFEIQGAMQIISIYP